MTEVLLKTPLFDLHVEQGAKMVPFAGYEMPVQYPLGVKKNTCILVNTRAYLMYHIWGSFALKVRKRLQV